MRGLTPQQAALALTGRPGPLDEPIPLDHKSVVILKELLRTPKPRDGSGHYENTRFAAFLILFSEYAPQRVGDMASILVNEELRRINSEPAGKEA